MVNGWPFMNGQKLTQEEFNQRIKPIQELSVTVYDDWTEWRNMEGELHRLDGPAVERTDGSKEWWVNGQRHRVDGPAYEYSDGTKSWWVNGQRHRVDGPAIIYRDGSKSWYVNGQELTEEEFNQKVDPVKELTVEEISKLLGYEVKVIKS